MGARRIATRAALLAATMLLAAPAVALASGPRLVLVPAFLGPIGQAIGSVFHAIASVVVGGLNWTVGVAAKFILNLLGGLIRLLIPASWAKDGLEVMHWIVAVPDYAGTITTPGGHVVYGFAGINALRDLFMWVGAALLPLSLVYATSRAALGGGRHVAAPVARVLGLAAVLVSYPWWWSQAAALVDQLTHLILGLPLVQHGIYRLMQYVVGGVALGGWQLIDLALMGAIGIALLSLIFLKVAVILLGALIYATGPLMIALVPSEGGLVVARAWVSAAAVLVALPVLWSTILAVGALLINDSATAGPLIAGSGTIASLLGGLLLALAGLASLWLCLKAAREAGGIVRGQFTGVLALGRQSRGVGTASASPAPAGRASASLRSFQSRVQSATGSALDAAGPAGRAVAAGGAGLAAVGRRGLIGAASSGMRGAAGGAAPGTAALVSRTRAGAAAVRIARAGAAGWRQPGSAGRRPGAAVRTGRVDGEQAGASGPVAGGGRVYTKPVATPSGPGRAPSGTRSRTTANPPGASASSASGGGASAPREGGPKRVSPSKSSGSAAARARRKPRGSGSRRGR